MLMSAFRLLKTLASLAFLAVGSEKPAEPPAEPPPEVSQPPAEPPLEIGQPPATAKPQRFRSVTGYFMLVESPQPYTDAALEAMGLAGQKPQGKGGGGLLAQLGRLIIDTGGAGGAVADAEDNATGYGHGHFSLGYALVRSRFLNIYPLLGVGGGGIGSPDKAGEPAAESRSASEGIAFAGVGMHVTFHIWKLALTAGLRVGYRVNLSGEGGTLPTGPFVNVIVGSGFSS